ncbi:MAG: LPS translocon maturation chaperone LptM [Woeseiaceae bacterium]
MKYPPRFAAALLLSMFLFGCGQSGPLYVAGNPSAADPISSESDSEKEDEQDAESSTSE